MSECVILSSTGHLASQSPDLQFPLKPSEGSSSSARQEETAATGPGSLQCNFVSCFLLLIFPVCTQRYLGLVVFFLTIDCHVKSNSTHLLKDIRSSSSALLFSSSRLLWLSRGPCQAWHFAMARSRSRVSVCKTPVLSFHALYLSNLVACLHF